MRGPAEVEAEIAAVVTLIRGRVPYTALSEGGGDVANRMRRLAVAVLTIAACEDPRLYDVMWSILWNDRSRRIAARTASLTAPVPLTGPRPVDLDFGELASLVEATRVLVEASQADPCDERPTLGERVAAHDVVRALLWERCERGGTVYGETPLERAAREANASQERADGVDEGSSRE